MADPLKSSELDVTVTDPVQDASIKSVETGQYVRLTVRPSSGNVSEDSKFNNLESVRIRWKTHPASQSTPASYPADRTDAAPLYAWGSPGKKKIIAEILYRLPSDSVRQKRRVQVSETISVNGKKYEKRFKDQIKDQKEDTKPTSFDTARILHGEYIDTVEDFGGEDGWKQGKVDNGDERIESKIRLWDQVKQNFAITYNSGQVGFTAQELWTKLGISDFSEVFTEEYRNAMRPGNPITAYDGFITSADGDYWRNQFANEIPFSGAQRQFWRDLGFAKLSTDGSRPTGHTVLPSTANLSSTREHIKDSFIKESFGTTTPKPDAVPEKHEFFWLGRQLLAHRFDMESKARDLVAFLKYGSPAAAGIALAGPGPVTSSPPSNKLHPANTDSCVRNYSKIQEDVGGYTPVFNSREWKCHLRETRKNDFETAPALSLQGRPGPEVVVGNDFLAELKAAKFPTQVEVLGDVLSGLSTTDVGKKYLLDLFKYRDRGGMINPLHVLDPTELSMEEKLKRTGENYISATSGTKQQVLGADPHEGKVTSDRVRQALEDVVPELLVGSSLFFAEAIQADELDESVTARFNGMVREAFTRKVENGDYKMVINQNPVSEPVDALKNHGPRNYSGKPEKYGFDDYASLANNTNEVAGAINDFVSYNKKAKHGWDWSSERGTRVSASLAAADVFVALTSFVHDLSSSGGLPSALGTIASFAGQKWHSMALATHSLVNGIEELSENFDASAYFGRFASDRVGIYLGGVGVLYSIIGYVGLIYDNAEFDVIVLNGVMLAMDVFLFAGETIAWAAEAGSLSISASVGGPIMAGIVIVSTLVALVGSYLHRQWRDTDVENWLEQTAYGIKWNGSEANYEDPGAVEFQFKTGDRVNYKAQSVKYGSVANPMNFTANTFPKQVPQGKLWTLSLKLDPKDSLRQGGSLFVRPVLMSGPSDSGTVYTLPWLHRIYLSENQSEVRSKSRVPIFPRSVAADLNQPSNSQANVERHQLAFTNWIEGHLTKKRQYDPDVAKTIANDAASAANNDKTILSNSGYDLFVGSPVWGNKDRQKVNFTNDSEYDWASRLGSSATVPNSININLETAKTNDQDRLEEFRVELKPSSPNAATVFGAPQDYQGSVPKSFDINFYEGVYVAPTAFVELTKQDVRVNTMEVPFTIGSKWEVYDRSG